MGFEPTTPVFEMGYLQVQIRTADPNKFVFIFFVNDVHWVMSFLIGQPL
jgi:hypothetical protein